MTLDIFPLPLNLANRIMTIIYQCCRCWQVSWLVGRSVHWLPDCLGVKHLYEMSLWLDMGLMFICQNKKPQWAPKFDPNVV